ncbi:MAG: PAS domain S-box protein, partial [Bacteroidia bacterium]
YVFISPEFQSALRKKNKALLKKGGTAVSEFKLKDKKGKILEVECLSKIIQVKGRPAQQCIFREISTYRNIIEQLEQTRHDFNLILQNIDEIVFYYDRYAQKVMYISKQIEKILGIKVSDYEKDPGQMLSWCHPDDLKYIYEAAEKVKNTKKTASYQYRIRNLKTKKYVWLEERIFPQFDKEGNHQGNLGVARDITKEKEDAIKIKESETKFRLLAENATDIVYQYSFIPEPAYVYVSPSVKKILGYTPGDFYKDPYLGYKIIHPEDVHLLRDSEKNVRSKKAIRESYEMLTVRYISKDKRIVWMETRFTEIKEGDKVVSLEGISRDITREKESERNFRLLADNASDVIFRFNLKPNPHYSYVSPSVERILGYTPEDFYKDPMYVSKIIHPEDNESILLLTQTDQFKGKLPFPQVHINRFFSKKKSLVWLETRYTPIKDKYGKIIEIQGISRDISLQKQNEMALFESERTLSNLFSNLPGMAYRCFNDDKWTMKFISNGCKELTGYEPKELIDNKKRSYASIVYPEDYAVGKKEIAQALEQGKIFEIEYRVTHKNGTEKWVWEKGEGVYSNTGELLYIEGFITDISQRKLYEKELNQQWTNYKTVVDHSPNGILIHSGGKVVFANKAAVKISGFEKEEELKQISLFDILLPEFRPMALERVKRVTEGEVVPPQEYRALTAKNQLIEIEVMATLIVFNGQPAVQVIISDLSAQKMLHRETLRAQLAEESNRNLQLEIEQRKKTELQLQQTQNYLRMIIDSSLDMICASDNKGMITEFNYAAQKTFGYKASEVIGKPISILYAHPDDRDEVYDQLINTNMAYSGEVQNRKKTGEPFISYLSASVLKNEKGEIIGSMGVSRDITEVKKQEQEIINQSAKLKAIFESSSHLIWTVNRNHELTSFNKNFANTLTDKFNIQPQLNKSVHSLLKETDRLAYTLYWYPLYQQVFEGNNLKFERLDVDSKNQHLYREIFLHPIYNEKNEVVEISCIAHDITENKSYEKQITEQSAKLKAIFESGDQLIWSVNRNIALTSFNKNYSDAIFDLYEVYPEINRDIERPKTMFTTEEYHGFWDEKYEEVFEGKSVEFVTERMNKKGVKKYRQVYLHPIYDENKNVVEVSGMAYDITELRFYEQETIKQGAKLKAIFDSGSHMIWSIDRSFMITSSNENFNKTFRFSTGDNLSDYTQKDKHSDKVDPEERKMRAEKYARAFKGESQHFEVKLFNEDGTAYWAEVFLEPVYDNNGEVYELSGIAHNITERKTAEEQIRQSLKEKEVLLKEVHHRVKNNLQVISSILNLQSTYARDSSTLNLLKECQNRIKSMAFIHESLYQTKDFTEINFSEYVLVLVKNLMHSYSSIDNRIKTRFEVENLLLNLDTSIPCGLIVNELVSNALKYAFPDNKEGYIFVQLKREKNKIVLSISDNGIGLPKDLDYRNTESLGLQLVVTLVEQIGGEIAINTEKGTNFTITFNY